MQRARGRRLAYRTVLSAVLSTVSLRAEVEESNLRQCSGEIMVKQSFVKNPAPITTSARGFDPGTQGELRWIQ
ncbi:MAG: hypothetical protein ACREE6_06430 [Limisphaerales bacterium]